MFKWNIWGNIVRIKKDWIFYMFFLNLSLDNHQFRKWVLFFSTDIRRCNLLLFKEIAPSVDLLRPLLPENPYLRSLKVDCGKLDDSAIQILLRPSLQELCLVNCSDFSGKLLSEIGGMCKNLRFSIML